MQEGPIRTTAGFSTELKNGPDCLAVDGAGTVYVSESLDVSAINGPGATEDALSCVRASRPQGDAELRILLFGAFENRRDISHRDRVATLAPPGSGEVSAAFCPLPSAFCFPPTAYCLVPSGGVSYN